MARGIFVAAVVALALGVFAARMPLDKKFIVPQVLSRHMNPPQEPMTFKWDSCGGNGNVVLNSLSLSPDPIQFNANLTASASVTTKVAITGGDLALKLQKKIVGVWTDIPCVSNIGSCTYNDFCSLLPNKPCPPPLPADHIPCQCPFAADTYVLPPTEFAIPALPNNVPAWLTAGDFYIRASLTVSGAEYACYEIYLSLGK
eukprot:TRINITY_DN1672_c0_g1_i1.p1 TRINITY_DN1672_c0_g1~~TRINITY_DN1672_c0_g1_i1.p1  ORF type:complete len:210 (-),score=78.72 TRINITY_DN1672_c0_g1_i1:149-751(-)